MPIFTRNCKSYPPSNFSKPVQLDYWNGITVLNSNNLGITNVNDFDYLVDLPDGFIL